MLNDHSPIRVTVKHHAIEMRHNNVFQEAAVEQGSASDGRMVAFAVDEWGLLMAAAQQGHAASYRRLLDEMRRWLNRFYTRRLPPAFVEDAVQDTLIAIHEKRHTYDPQRPFKPWLMVVARHKWIDRLRSISRSAAEDLSDDVAVEDHESSVTSAVVLERLLGQLKHAQALAIRLVKLEGFSVEETSMRTGQSCALVKVNVHRGLSHLARLIDSQGEQDQSLGVCTDLGPVWGQAHGSSRKQHRSALQ